MTGKKKKWEPIEFAAREAVPNEKPYRAGKEKSQRWRRNSATKKEKGGGRGSQKASGGPYFEKMERNSTPEEKGDLNYAIGRKGMGYKDSL